MKNPKTTATMSPNNNSKWCFSCNAVESSSTILHHTHHTNTSYIHLCTNCILRANPSLFCCLCLSPFSSNNTTKCLHCTNSAHTYCMSHTPHPFVCPACIDPSFKFFNTNQDSMVKDIASARALVCGAVIAAGSMTRAAKAARGEAERRGYEAVVAKRRARLALESFMAVFDVEEENGNVGDHEEVDGAAEDHDRV